MLIGRNPDTFLQIDSEQKELGARMVAEKDHNFDRNLTVSWDDPMVGAEAARKMSGLDFLKAIVAGEIPPPPISKRS